MIIQYSKQTRILVLSMLGSVLASLAVLTYIFDPVQLLTIKLTSLTPGSMFYDLFQQPPYEIFAKVFIFNVTNSEAFLEGREKVRVEELGPYVYREELYNVNLTFHDNGTLSFIPKRRLHFDPERSARDPNEKVLVPNIPLLGISAVYNGASFVERLALSSLTSMFSAQTFLNLSVNDYLYGYDDDLVTVANTIMPGWIDFSRFGIFDRLMALDNGTEVATINLKSEDTMSSQVPLYAIERWNGLRGLRQWGFRAPVGNETVPGNTACNTMTKTFMGTMFPRNLPVNTSFSLYRNAFCRPVPFHYSGTRISSDGFEGYVFTTDKDYLSKPETNPGNQCFCNAQKCEYDGLGDMSTCYYKIPITMSQPHFLNADPFLREQVDGMQPDEEKHEQYLIVHPEMGLPLEVKLRLQINLKMPDTTFNSKVTPFRNLVIPLFWVELEVESVPWQVKLCIVMLYSVLPIVQKILMVVFGVVGVGLVFASAVSAVLYILDSRRPKTRTGLRIGYSEIPMFSLKSTIVKPELLLDK